MMKEGEKNELINEQNIENIVNNEEIEKNQ